MKTGTRLIHVSGVDQESNPESVGVLAYTGQENPGILSGVIPDRFKPLLSLPLLAGALFSVSVQVSVPMPAMATPGPAPSCPPGCHVDLSLHLGMSSINPFMKGPEARNAAEPTAAHAFQSVLSADALRKSCARIFVNVAWSDEDLLRPTRAWKRHSIRKQLAQATDLVAKQPEEFAIARSAVELETLLRTTRKKIIIQGIEGISKSIRSLEDVREWKEQYGVSFVTVAHLLETRWAPGAPNTGDGSYLLGHAMSTSLYRGVPSRTFELIDTLADNGILVDLTHLAPHAWKPVLDHMESRGIPPIISHGKLLDVRNEPTRGLDRSTICQVYRSGGMMGIALAGNQLKPLPQADGRAPRSASSVTFPKDYCAGTQDDFQVHADHLKRTLESCIPEIFPSPTGQPRRWADLTEDEKRRLAYTYGSDWDGWTDHGGSKAKICGQPLPPQPSRYQAEGLYGPEALPEMFAELGAQGMDLEPFGSSCNRFSEIWTQLDLRRQVQGLNASPESQIRACP